MATGRVSPTTSKVFPRYPEDDSSRNETSASPFHTNIFQLLALREISPQSKRVPRNFYGTSSKCRTSVGLSCKEIDARNSLTSWVEAESLRHLSAKYCPLFPPPRSTIAAAFSSNGKTLASTHGDHTVKIIDCQTGRCLKVLSGHRRTPWVVRFHPVYPEILASGSLDHEVRLWDANTADCIGSKDFYRPIASIAFHAQGELLAVASGHKLYIWNYNKREGSSPTIVLKTRRSLRAVHFHPHAAPFLLTAEVNDLDSPDTPLAPATTSGFLQYAPPAMFFTNFHSITHLHGEVGMASTSLGSLSTRRNHRTSLQGQTAESNMMIRAESPVSGHKQLDSYDPAQHDVDMTPIDRCANGASCSNCQQEEIIVSLSTGGVAPVNSDVLMGDVETTGQQAHNNMQRSTISVVGTAPSFQQNESDYQHHIRQSRLGYGGTSSYASGSLRIVDSQMLLRNIDDRHHHQFVPSSDPPCWEFPFLQGWLLGQTHAGSNAVLPTSSSRQENTTIGLGLLSDVPLSGLPQAHGTEPFLRGPTRPGIQYRPFHGLITTGTSRNQILQLNVQDDNPVHQSAGFNIESEVASSISSDSSTDLPCTVKLRIWPYDVQKPYTTLDCSTCRLTIPHAVLCSEMGAHFSPCGRFLAACVACVLPHVECDPGLHSQSHHDSMEEGTSPTRHPISGHRVIYELRVYSLEEATFGLVLASRAIRAAHCLTSIQFSPTSEHILVAYGRRHTSLLKSFFTDGESKMHIYTILEVYRVSDMELVSVLPSAEDEVNVACFHPLVGCGLAYGTKEGKLRILQFDGHVRNKTDGYFSLDENILEIRNYALES